MTKNCNDIEIYADDFVCSISGDTPLEDLEQVLAESGLTTALWAPASYSLEQILRDNHGGELYKKCLGLEIEHASGRITKTGGMVIKNVSGYDLRHIYIGSQNPDFKFHKIHLRLQKLEVAKQYPSEEEYQAQLGEMIVNPDEASFIREIEELVSKF